MKVKVEFSFMSDLTKVKDDFESCIKKLAKEKNENYSFEFIEGGEFGDKIILETDSDPKEYALKASLVNSIHGILFNYKILEIEDQSLLNEHIGDVVTIYIGAVMDIAKSN